jgi:hypothetical protein
MRSLVKTDGSLYGCRCSMLNVKCKNFHQMVFCFLIHHMSALITYVLQPLMLTFLLNLIANNAAMYNILLAYGFPIFFIEPLFFTHTTLSYGLGFKPAKLAARLF